MVDLATIPLPPTDSVVKQFLEYDTFRTYPIVTYINLDYSEPRISDVPGRNYVRVLSYVLFSSDKQTGFVLHDIGSDIIIVPFIYENNTVLPGGDDVAIKVIDEYVKIATGEMHRKLSKHELKALSLLTCLGEDEIKYNQKVAEIEKELEDKPVAVFSDFVVVLSKKHILKRFDGVEAVEIAKRVAFPVDAPISAIASHLRKYVSSPVTAFVSSSTSVVCSKKRCVPVPLPKNILSLVLKAMKVQYSMIDPVNLTDESSVTVSLPSDVDAVGVSRRGFVFLKKTGARYEVVKRYNVKYNVPSVTVFTRTSIETGKYAVRGSKVYVEIMRGVPNEKEECDEKYLEQVVLDC